MSLMVKTSLRRASLWELPKSVKRDRPAGLSGARLLLAMCRYIWDGVPQEGNVQAYSLSGISDGENLDG